MRSRDAKFCVSTSVFCVSTSVYCVSTSVFCVSTSVFCVSTSVFCVSTSVLPVALVVSAEPLVLLMIIIPSKALLIAVTLVNRLCCPFNLVYALYCNFFIHTPYFRKIEPISLHTVLKSLIVIIPLVR